MRLARRSRSGRLANLALLVLVPLAVFTGLFANAIGGDWPVDPAFVHALSALGAVILAPWKSVTVRRGAARGRGYRWFSYGLLALTAAALLSGLVHAAGLAERVGPLTLMQVHVGAAVGALLLLAVHFAVHPVRPRRTDLNRRLFLKGAGVTGAAAAFWLGWEGIMRAAGWRGAERRFTGSHQRGSFAPELMPVTSWLDDRTPHIREEDWRLRIDGRSLSYQELAGFPQQELDAVLDCTGGWFSEQRWRGVRLDGLVEAAGARSIRVRSATGYDRRFPVRDLPNLWLATSVGGARLSPGHGFPARIAAPGRRGFWWVKWVTEIETSSRPWWAQLPFPVT